MPKGDEKYLFSDKMVIKYPVLKEFLTIENRFNKKKVREIFKVLNEEEQKEYTILFSNKSKSKSKNKVDEVIEEQQNKEETTDEELQEILEDNLEKLYTEKELKEKIDEHLKLLAEKGDIKILNDNLFSKKNSIIEKPKNPLKPIIKWSGGKKDEIKFFEKHLPNNYDIYIEPFIGGGSLYFHLYPKKSVIADVHKELICFYNSIKEGHIDKIYDFMVNHPNDEKVYYEVRDKMIINNDLDRAKQFYYQRKTCFRGMLRYNKHGKFNIPYGRYKNCNYEDLKNKDYEKLLKNTDIINGSFEIVFEKYNSENNFVFLDPPYDSEFTDYGYCNFGKEEHKKLADCFKKTKNKCLMIIGKTDFIVDLYKDYIVEEYDKNYKFKIHSKRVGKEIDTKHLVIKNY